MRNLINYRPDVDGLRAIAVLLVIFFHVGYSTFSGGYIGVDVFFVISGFLITQMIVTDIEKQRFTFTNFYIRRARRIFPALFFTLLVTFIAGVIIFSPTLLQQLSKSTIYALLSLSNFLFWSEAGYFDTAAELKPLLHTWSLGVEEQFYFIWPLMLSILLSFKRPRVAIIFLIICGIASLLLSQFWLSKDPEGAFYLLPTRIVEFVIGALCVWMVRKPIQNAIYNELLVAAGLVAVVYPALVYTDQTIFPGINVLLPCLGTGAIIYSCNRAKLSALLNNRLIVGIGLISYSLYLIHWPILVYVKYWQFGEITAVGQAAVIMSSLVAAVLMYLFVEQPFRLAPGQAGYLTPPAFGLTCAGLALLLTFPVANAWGESGWLWRVSPEIQLYMTGVKNLRDNKLVKARDKEQYPGTNRINGLIIGDSHATDLFNAIESNSPVAYIKRRGISIDCQPVIGDRLLLNKVKSDRCKYIFNRILKSDDLSGSDYVLFSVRWQDWAADRIPETLSVLRKHTTANIIVFGPAVEFYPDIPDLIYRHGKLKGLKTYINQHKVQEVLDLNAKMKEMSKRYGFTFIDKISILCGNEACPVFIPGTNKLMYVDYGHWTNDGARYFGQLLKSKHPELVNIL